jgi:hypothetical protein
MAKYLKLGADPSVERWVLPDDTNLDELAKEIDVAMTEGGCFRTRVVVGPDHTGELLINGKAVAAAVVWDDSRTKPTFTLID